MSFQPLLQLRIKPFSSLGVIAIKHPCVYKQRKWGEWFGNFHIVFQFWTWSFVSDFICLALALLFKPEWFQTIAPAVKLLCDLICFINSLRLTLGLLKKSALIRITLSTHNFLPPAFTSLLTHLLFKSATTLRFRCTKILPPSEKTSLVWSLSFHWCEARAQGQSDSIRPVSHYPGLSDTSLELNYCILVSELICVICIW